MGHLNETNGRDNQRAPINLTKPRSGASLVHCFVGPWIKRQISSKSKLLLIFNNDFGVLADLWNRIPLFPKQSNTLPHSPSCPIDAVLHRMPNACKALQIRGIKPKTVRLFGGFDNPATACRWGRPDSARCSTGRPLTANRITLSAAAGSAQIVGKPRPVGTITGRWPGSFSNSRHVSNAIVPPASVLDSGFPRNDVWRVSSLFRPLYCVMPY
jgi:hypothetical protein